MSDSTQISAITGLSIDEIQSRAASAKPENTAIESIVGKKVDTSVQPIAHGDPLASLNKKVELTNIYTDPLSNYIDYGVPLNPFADWNEERAQRQSTGQKWAHGLAKAGITSLGAVYENTIGVLAGLGSLATGGEYYDNFVGRSIDSVNNWAQTNLPNYYTHAEQTGSVLSNMGTANFWADKVANGAGYTLGSIATMWLGTGELGLAAKLGSATAKGVGAVGKAVGIGGELAEIGAVTSKELALYRAGKAVATGKKLERVAAASRLATASERLAVATQMSLAEASVEARETKNRFIEEQVSAWKEQNPGLEIPDDVMGGITQSANAAGNATFAINLPILATSNLIMFKNMFRGVSIGEKAMYDIGREAPKSATWVEKVGTTKFGKAYSRAEKMFGPSVRNMGTEGFQEGAQFAASEFSRDYYGEKFNSGSGDMIKSLGNGLSATIGSREGLENVLIGAIVGGGSGAVSRIFGADKKLAKTRTANTKTAIDYMTAGGMSKLLQNLEANDYNTAQVNKIDAANKVLQDPEATPAQKAVARQTAERARMQLIRSEATRMENIGATDYMLEQLDDAASMPEDEFKKAFGYEASRTLQEQTGKTQQELVQEVKDTAKLSIKRANQVQDILARTKPKATFLPRLLESLQSEELRNSKVLQTAVRNFYASTVHSKLLDIDVIDGQIDELYDHLLKIAPELAQLPKEDFTYLVKVGKIEMDDKGNPKINPSVEIKGGEKLTNKLNEIFAAKLALNPADAMSLKDAASNMLTLVRNRQALVDSFENMIKSPEDMDLYMEAELMKQQAQEKAAAADRAKQAIENAETPQELNSSLPDDMPEEVAAQAAAKLEQLEEAQRVEEAKFTTMSDEELQGINPEDLTPIQEAAYNAEVRRRGEAKYFANAVQAPDQAQPTSSFEEVVEEFTDAQEAAYKEISVSKGGNIFTISNRTFLNLEEEPTDSLIIDTNGEIIGVRLTDAATGNTITWMGTDNADTEQAQKDTAIFEALAYTILLQANSIRSSEEMATISKEEAKAIAEIRGTAIREDVIEKETKEVTAAKEGGDKKVKNFEVTQTEEDPEAFEKEQEEFAKLVALSDIGTTAGLTDGQIRMQIEVIKQDLIEMDEILAAERQIAMEAGFTKEEFNKDGNVKTLKALKRSHTALLKKKTAELAKRNAANKQEVGTPDATEEIEQVASQEVVDQLSDSSQRKIQAIQDEIAELQKIASGYEKIIAGEYEGQDIDAAKAALRNLERKISTRKEKIRKENELIKRLQDDRESEELRQNSDVTEGAGNPIEGQESEATNIDPAAGTTTERVDGTTGNEEVERLRKQREQLEQIDRTMTNPVDGVVPAPVVTPEPVVVTSGPVNAPLVKGEMQSNEDFTEQIVDASGNPQSMMLTQKVNGQVVSIFPEMLTDNTLTPAGTMVTFEVDESTDWWNSNDPTTNNNKKDLTEDRYWEQVPIYVVATLPNGQTMRVATLAAYNPESKSGSTRKDIYNLYKSGITPAATIDEKLFNSTNIANARTADGQKFFYPASNITQKAPKIAVVRIKDSLPTFVDQAGNELPFEASNVALGQIAIIVEDPNGNPALVMASTKSMTEEGRAVAVNNITKDNPEPHLFGEIVGLNSLPVTIAEENDTIEIPNGETIEDLPTFMSQVTLADGTVLFSFYSKSANKIVRVNEVELKKALLGQDFKFSFSEAAKNDRGWTNLVTVQADPTAYSNVKGNLKQEFMDLIMTKKFQVSIDQINNTEPYVSAITGKQYPSYFDYLNSKEEFTDARTEGLGANVILAVDSPGNSNKSPFYDVGLKFSPLQGIGGDIATQEQLAVSAATEILNSVDTTTPKAPSAATSLDVESRKKKSLENRTYSKIGNGNFWIYYTPTGSEIEMFVQSNENVNDAINAKYDAELAALEKPATQAQPTVPSYNSFFASFGNPKGFIESQKIGTTTDKLNQAVQFKNSEFFTSSETLPDDKIKLAVHFKHFEQGSSRSGGHAGLVYVLPAGTKLTNNLIEALLPEVKSFRDSNFTKEQIGYRINTNDPNKIITPSTTQVTIATKTEPTPAPVVQNASDVAVDELPADLFGPSTQKPVSLNTPPAAFAHLKPSPEMQAQLSAEMQAELRGLNPMGGSMQSLSDIMRSAAEEGEKKKKECN